MAAKKSRLESRAPARKEKRASKRTPSASSSRSKAARPRSADEISELDREAIGALERFAQYARVALTTSRGDDPRAASGPLQRIRTAYECIYGHPVALMAIVREAKHIVDAVTLHRHSPSEAVDLEGVPTWVGPKAFARLVASIPAGRGGDRAATGAIVAGVVRLVHARCPHPGAKRLRTEHLAQP